MNKFFKKISIPLFFMFFASSAFTFATDNFNIISPKFSLASKIKTNENVSKQLENNIIKDDSTIIKEYFIPNNKTCNYKYLKVIKNITYMDKLNKKNIATSSIESTYRYNINTREAECLSSTYTLGNYNDEYLLDVSSRSLNKNTELGCAMMNVNFSNIKSIRKTLDKENSEITCDYQGKINSFNID